MIDRDKLPRFLVAAIIGVSVATFAMIQSAKVVYDRHNPTLAARLLGSERAKVRLWTASTFGNPSRMADPAIVAHVRGVLKMDPLNAPALRALALHREASQQRSSSVMLARLSNQVSRRDPLTQLILAQDAIQKADTQQAIEHFDIALTTINRGREQVFPTMATLFKYPALREELPTLLERPNSWMGDYLDYTMRREPDGARNVAEVLLEADPKGAVPILDRFGDDLISFLAESGNADLLRRIYKLARGDRPDITETSSINRFTVDPKMGWLSWSGVGEGSIGATPRVIGDDADISVYASAGTSRAIALRRVVMLPPGTYRHFEDRELVFGPETASANFEMRCIGGTREETIWKALSSGMGNDTAGGNSLTVPRGCPVQMLELFVTSPMGSGGSEFVIRSFDLRRVS